MTEKYLVDTNIIIYAFDSSEGKHNTAKEFMKKAAYDEDARLSVQNLAEFYINITKPKKSMGLPEEIAIKKLDELVQAFGTINYYGSTILDAAALQKRHKIHFWDGLIAATMRENMISTIYTENTRDFDKIPGINAANPFKRNQEYDKPIK